MNAEDPTEFKCGTHHYVLDESEFAAAIFYQWYECKVCNHRELFTYDIQIKAFMGLPRANNIIYRELTCDEIIMQNVME